MEIEYFVKESDAPTFFKQRQEESMKFWQEVMQFDQAHIRFREHEADELSHYSKGTFDVEFSYPW
jgi:glycyl-tRNA synthetase